MRTVQIVSKLIKNREAELAVVHELEVTLYYSRSAYLVEVIHCFGFKSII